MKVRVLEDISRGINEWIYFAGEILEVLENEVFQDFYIIDLGHTIDYIDKNKVEIL